MIQHFNKGCFALLVGPGLCACVQVNPKPEFDEARRLFQESTGQSELFDPYSPASAEEDIEAVLADGMSLQEALRLALTNNRELQAEFQDIGIAHADWVQSQLLTNPSLDLLLRFPSDGGRALLEAAFGMQLLELWRAPLQEQEAKKKLQSTTLRIARSAGERLTRARDAYYSVLVTDELYALAREDLELATLSYEVIRELQESGGIDALSASLARTPALAARLHSRSARAESRNARRRLANALSLRQTLDEVQLTDSLPEASGTEVSAQELVRQALDSRLDIQAISSNVEALKARVALERRKAWGDASVGPLYEGSFDNGVSTSGPALSLSLPIFDQNQAQVSRASFELEQMIKLQEAAEIKLTHDIRMNADRVNAAAADMAFYAEELLPQAQKSIELAEKSFAAGRINRLELIEVRRGLLATRGDYIRLRFESALAASELERSVGARIE